MPVQKSDIQGISEDIMTTTDCLKNLNRVPNIILGVTLLLFVGSLFL